jgi:dTDP-glucose 4,6-dehydratase
MRVIVTGGAGFIGSAVCRHLAGESATVLNIDKLTYCANPLTLDSLARLPNYHFKHADICDSASLDAVFAEFRPQAVIHLAAESHVDRSITSADDFIETNIVGTYTLLQSAHRYWRAGNGVARDFRFLQVSTDEVYGSLGPKGFFTETTSYDPSSPYSASKAAADHLAAAWHCTYGLPVILSNCSNNFGPYQFPEKLIPLHILNLIAGKSLPVYGDGSHIRDWLYVDDHARALHLVLLRGKIGERYLIGARNERSNLDVAEQLCAVMDELRPESAPHRRLITHVGDRPGHDRRYAIDPSKLEQELGWRPRENFDSGLGKTVGWYVENRAWWEPLRANVYGGQRLGLLGPGLVSESPARVEA